MASLKDLKNRIKSVKNTQKITKAMKMVAAAKLRRAKEQAESARPYAERMDAILTNLARSVGAGGSQAPYLLSGTGRDQKHLLVVATGDRGLAGAFNSSIVRASRKKIAELQAAGKDVRVMAVGRKSYEQLVLQHGSLIAGRVANLYRTRPDYQVARELTDQILELARTEEIDVVTIVYNKFKSAISQEVTFQQLIPLAIPADPLAGMVEAQSAQPVYEYEPDEEEILADLLPKNLSTQIYRALIENAASEQGARMSAMDNATRNAGEMIGKLTLKYNRSRQAAITKELIEIISGAEAV